MSRFRFLHNGIICDTYIPSTNCDYSKSGIVLSGYPATIGENKITQLIVNHGYVAYQPHYPGTYDSDGNFNPQTCIKMVGTIVDSIKDGHVENLKSLKQSAVASRIRICVGNSFGCLIALNSLNVLPDLEVMILLAPVISYGPSEISCGFHTAGLSFLEYIKRSRPYTYRIGDPSEWKKLYSGYYNVPKSSFGAKLKCVYGVVGEEDSSFDIDILKRNFQAIVRQFVGEVPLIDLIVIKGAGHSSGDLLSRKDFNPVNEKLCKLLNNN